jgi:multiple sugar transport system substrate-binding protein
MKIRRSLAGAAALAISVVIASACSSSGSSGSGSGSSSSGGKVTLNFYGTENAAYYNGDIAAFDKANPNVTIKYHIFPFDSLDDVLTSRLQTHDNSFSLYEVDEPRIPQFASKGWLVPFTSPDHATLSKDLLAEQLDEATYNGKVWALPMETSTQFLYYNKKLLQQAGVTPPSSSPSGRWTWDQLETAAQKVHQKTGKDGILFEQSNRIYQMQPITDGLGGGPGVTGKDGLTPDVDNAAWIQGMNWYSNLIKTGITPKSETANTTEPEFAAGGAAFFVGGPWDYYPYLHAKGLSFGIAAQPYWSGHAPQTPTDSWALGVNPYGPNQGIAKKFIEYVTLNSQGALIQLQNSSGGSGGSTSGPGNPPANLVALKKYYTLWPAAAGNLIKYELNHTAVHRARSLGWVQFETVMDSTYQSIADGVKPATALANAQSTLKSDFSQISASQP